MIANRLSNFKIACYDFRLWSLLLMFCLYLFIRQLNSRLYYYLFYRTTEARRSVQSIPLWTKRRLQRGNLHVPSKLFRWSILVLSSRMHYEFGLLSSKGVCQSILRGSLYWHVWNQCEMRRGQSHSYVQLFPWYHWRSIHTVSTTDIWRCV